MGGGGRFLVDVVVGGAASRAAFAAARVMLLEELGLELPASLEFEGVLLLELLLLLVLLLLLPNPPSVTLDLSTACCSVSCLAFRKKSGLLLLYSRVISGMSPSSGLGSAMSRYTELSTVCRLSEHRHAPLGGIFNVSRHMRPPESMLGW